MALLFSCRKVKVSYNLVRCLSCSQMPESWSLSLSDSLTYMSFHWVVIHDDEEWFAVFSDSPPLKFEGSGSATTIFRPEWTFMEPLRTLCTAQSEIARRT